MIIYCLFADGLQTFTVKQLQGELQDAYLANARSIAVVQTLCGKVRAVAG
jgi:hypothetical protein